MSNLTPSSQKLQVPIAVYYMVKITPPTGKMTCQWKWVMNIQAKLPLATQVQAQDKQTLAFCSLVPFVKTKDTIEQHITLPVYFSFAYTCITNKLETRC